MSHGYSSVNLSSLTSMFPETGFYDSTEGDDDAADAFQGPADSLKSGSSAQGATLLSALDPTRRTSDSNGAQSSGLFDLSDDMMFSMMDQDEYGADPMASFGNYNSYSPHWKTDGGGTSSDSAMQDALMNKLAASDSSQTHRRKLQ